VTDDGRRSAGDNGAGEADDNVQRMRGVSYRDLVVNLGALPDLRRLQSAGVVVSLKHSRMERGNI
jgi:hypothetical protein